MRRPDPDREEEEQDRLEEVLLLWLLGVVLLGWLLWAITQGVGWAIQDLLQRLGLG